MVQRYEDSVREEMVSSSVIKIAVALLSKLNKPRSTLVRKEYKEGDGDVRTQAKRIAKV